MKAKTLGKVISVLLSVCMLVTLFTCLCGLSASASASDTKMLHVTSANSGNLFYWRWETGYSHLTPGTKYRMSLDWENVSNAPFGDTTFNIIAYASGGWKVINNNDSYVSEWTVTSGGLANGNHYNIDFTTTESVERELIFKFGDVNSDITGMEFKTANWVLYTRDADNNLTDISATPTFGSVSWRDASNKAMNNFIANYTATDKGSIWRKSGMASDDEFIDIPEGYFAVNCAHDNTTVVPAVASTCTTAGHAEYTVCDDCGAIVSGSDAALPLDPANHEAGTGVEATVSTCTTAGHAAYTVCSGCGAVIDGSADALPLDPDNHTGEGSEVRDVVAATCTEAGYTGNTYCTGCNAKLSDGEVITALGHNYVEAITLPTCTEAGYTTHTCSRCGDSY
ncbi:MAG: hypothetical protein J5662_01685, partial [Clostridia bacterium]|nr:hypothetical protein [Clostridia bacterium]